MYSQLLQYCQFVLNVHKKAKAVTGPMAALAAALQSVALFATRDAVCTGILVMCSKFECHPCRARM